MTKAIHVVHSLVQSNVEVSCLRRVDFGVIVVVCKNLIRMLIDMLLLYTTVRRAESMCVCVLLRRLLNE